MAFPVPVLIQRTRGGIARSETVTDRIEVAIASSKSSLTQIHLEVFGMALITNAKWKVRGSSFLAGAVNLVNGKKIGIRRWDRCPSLD